MSAKLRKSVKSYLRLRDRVDYRKPRSPEYVKALACLRSLYSEFGRERVREAIANG